MAETYMERLVRQANEAKVFAWMPKDCRAVMAPLIIKQHAREVLTERLGREPTIGEALYLEAIMNAEGKL